MTLLRLPGKFLSLVHRVLLRVALYRRLVIAMGLDSFRYKKYYRRLHLEDTGGVSLGEIDHYKDESGDQKIVQLVENLSRHIPEPRSVLDIGCGTGRYLKQMQTMWPGSRFEGIDISREIVEKFTRPNIPDIPVHILDIETDRRFHTQNDGKFQLVCMIAIIQILSLKRITGILRQVRDLLEPGGYLYLQFNVETAEKKSSLGYKRYSIDELSQLLTRLEFEVVASRRTDILKDYAYVIGRKGQVRDS